MRPPACRARGPRLVGRWTACSGTRCWRPERGERGLAAPRRGHIRAGGLRGSRPRVCTSDPATRMLTPQSSAARGLGGRSWVSCQDAGDWASWDERRGGPCPRQTGGCRKANSECCSRWATARRGAGGSAGTCGGSGLRARPADGGGAADPDGEPCLAVCVGGKDAASAFTPGGTWRGGPTQRVKVEPGGAPAAGGGRQRDAPLGRAPYATAAPRSSGRWRRHTAATSPASPSGSWPAHPRRSRGMRCAACGCLWSAAAEEPPCGHQGLPVTRRRRLAPGRRVARWGQAGAWRAGCGCGAWHDSSCGRCRRATPPHPLAAGSQACGKVHHAGFAREQARQPPLHDHGRAERCSGGRGASARARGHAP
jgi:hypothetical protein